MSEGFDFNKALKKLQSGKAIRIDTPRDRSGTFEPQLVKKNQGSISNEFESKILSMYGHGMSYGEISEHVEEMYGISVSNATLSAVTDKIIGEVKAWQQRELESHYPFVWNSEFGGQ